MIASHLQRILTWADTQVPGLRASMRPGATHDAIRAVEQQIGATLPTDVVELYLLHDGQALQDQAGFIFGLPLLSLDDALECWSSWQSLRESQPDLQGELAERMTAFPPDTIAPQYIHRAWFPLTDDSSGNHIGVDLSPGPLGRRGQLITFGQREDEKLLLAWSLTDFLGWYASELERGNARVEIDEDEDEDGNPLPPVIESFSIKEPALHFHDAARQLRRTRGPFCP